MGSPDNPLMPPTDVTVSGLVQSEADPRKRAALESLGQKDAGWFGNIWAHLFAGILKFVIYVLTEFVGDMDLVFAAVAPVFMAGQGEKNASFYDLSAAILEDLTGVPVDKVALKNSAFGSGRLAAMQTFGGDLYKTLATEFAPTSGNLEAGDVAPAEKFLGFLMNFAIRQGNIEALVQCLPEEVRIGEGFRAYGELMAHNLGLGRMARRALQPLIQVLIADPLMYQLQEQYRPKRIGASPAIKKFFRDSTFETQMRKELGQEGYTDARIDDLITDLRPLVSEHHLVQSLFRFGDIGITGTGTQTHTPTQALAQRGYSDLDVQDLINVSRPILDKAEITALYSNGPFDDATAVLYLNKLGYDDATAKLVLQAHTIEHSHTHRLGLGELKRAFHNNVIDLLTLKAHLTSYGYSDDDIQIITLDLLQPTHGKVRQLSLAEIKAGVKAGVLTMEQATEHLTTLGFSAADITTIEATFPVTTPATPASTPTSTAGSAPTTG